MRVGVHARAERNAMTDDVFAAHVGPPPDLDRFRRALAVLSYPTRLHTVLLLAQGERDLQSLCRELKQSQPELSHHLGILRAAGLVANRRAGRYSFYRLHTPNCVAEVARGAVTVDLTAYSLRFTLGGEPRRDA